jgi:hypothetical protein
LPRHCPSQREGAGKAGRPEHPQPVCIGSKHTVVTTSTPENTRPSPRNGFNGFLRALPGDEFLFVTVVSRIDGAVRPVGQNLASADLTSATDARTTRLRRTQRPQPPPRQAMCCLPKSDRGVEAPFVLHALDRSRGSTRPAIIFAPDAAASTTSHPASVTMANAPLGG